MEEIWKDIAGYEGLYQVSNMGQVKSLNYLRTGREQILKHSTDGRGYQFVKLYKKGKKMHKIHRLVLMTFNPVENMNELEVNHIDECKTNNMLGNLEWCTREYNINYGTHTERMSRTKSIPVVQLTLTGEKVNVFESIIEAERQLGFSQGHIVQCCKNERKSHKGYKWQYLFDYLMNKHRSISKLILNGKEFEKES